jgi:iron-sulfur cluster repair protein YtfE (RIC family)
LHTHHGAEDAALWPRLYAAVSDADEIQVLTDMETEHGSLDPRLEQIDAAIEARNATALDAEFKALAKGLSAHMIHEEMAALPLLERRTGKAGWESFTKEIRGQQGGLKGAAEYLPWVLDGATDETTTRVLNLLPPPVRLLYRRWVKKYRSSGRLAQPR